MKRPVYSLLLLIACVLVSGCQTDYAALPTYSPARQLQAVIEIPAGSGYSIKYNRGTGKFENDKEISKAKAIPFLPYPANYGFIPSTEVGPDGDALPILVLTERVETGIVMEVLPIATLMLEKANGDLHPVIIAVPSRPSEQLISVADYTTLTLEYPVVKSILQQWFVNHNPSNPLKFISWKDEKFTEKEIQRWMKL